MDGVARRGDAGTDTQRMLFHVPDGASGTVDRSVAAGVDVDAAVDEAMAAADGDGDADADTGAVAAGLAAGKGAGEPLAATPTQPAATSAVNATSALHLRQPRLLTNLDSTACPSGRSSLRERVGGAIVEGRGMVVDAG